MCKKCVEINADDLMGLPTRKGGRGAMPMDLGALLGLVMRDIMPDGEAEKLKAEKLNTFGEPVKLKNGKWGLKISRKDKFIVERSVKVLNGNGNPFPLIGFIRKNRNSPCHWIMATGCWFSDDYFYIETEEPRVKITLAEIEEKLGFKVEIVG